MSVSLGARLTFKELRVCVLTTLSALRDTGWAGLQEEEEVPATELVRGLLCLRCHVKIPSEWAGEFLFFFS